jgi:hypothetical protein
VRGAITALALVIITLALALAITALVDHSVIGAVAATYGSYAAFAVAATGFVATGFVAPGFVAPGFVAPGFGQAAAVSAALSAARCVVVMAVRAGASTLCRFATHNPGGAATMPCAEQACAGR